MLIHGGGVGGLALAVKLASRGVHVGVVEQLPSESPLYKGELLQPKSLSILDDLDVLPEVLRYGHSFRDLQFIELERRNDNSPFVVGESEMDYGKLESVYNYALMVPHEQLKRILLTEAKKYPEYFTYIQPARFIGFSDGAAQIRHSKDKTVETISSRIYVGAEGRNSPTRNAMGLNVENRTYNHHFLTVTMPRPDDFTNGKIVTTNHRFLGLFPLPDNEIRTVFLIKAGAYKSMKEQGLEYFHQAYAELCPDLKEHVKEIQSWKDVQLMIPTMYHVEKYVQDNMVLLGDAAHAVHPMAGEGMNLAIQDADVLGELIAWMKETDDWDMDNLDWYEKVRRPRAKFLLGLSHLSALAYSFPSKVWRRIRIKSIQQMEHDAVLHVKQMLNISGLGRWDDTFIDRLIQVGMLPRRKREVSEKKQLEYFFHRTEDYPWEK